MGWDDVPFGETLAAYLPMPIRIANDADCAALGEMVAGAARGFRNVVIRLQNELTQALNQGTESPEYIKTLALAVTAQRYSQLPDSTPAHELEQLWVRLEQAPADTAALARLLTTAVRAVRLTSDKHVELELIKVIALYPNIDGAIISVIDHRRNLP